MTYDTFVPEPLHDNSPSDRLVYTTLQHQGPQTIDELVEETGLSRSSVERAVKSLCDDGVLKRQPDLRNPRRHRYITTP